MTDWSAIVRARNLNIPPEAMPGICASLDPVEAAFRPLLKQLTLEIEPAVTLSESAVLGE